MKRMKAMTQAELTSDDLEVYMQANDMQGQIVFLEAPTPTVEAAAAAVHADQSRS